MVKIIFDLFIPAVVEIIRDVEKLNLFELYKLEKKKFDRLTFFDTRAPEPRDRGKIKRIVQKRQYRQTFNL